MSGQREISLYGAVKRLRSSSRRKPVFRKRNRAGTNARSADVSGYSVVRTRLPEVFRAVRESP